jgi:hypothetical protein
MRDIFIHAIIDGIGGTCGSLSVLYAAIGRRLGYPLKIVKAARHLFLRWDDADGSHHWAHADRFNIEATGPGVHFLPDEHYRKWPHQISDDDIAAGMFLKSLSQQEELAEFMATRGYCLRSNERLLEAADTLAQAARLAPNNRYFSASYQSLKLHLMMRRRGHAFLNAAILGHPGTNDMPEGPFWVDGLGGHRVLVQVPGDEISPPMIRLELGQILNRQSVRLPDGRQANAFVPNTASHPRMAAHWLRTLDGRYLLIHQPVFPGPAAAAGHDDRQSHWPCGVPALSHEQRAARSGNLFGATNSGMAEFPELPAHEGSYLLGRIRIAAQSHREEECAAGLPVIHSFAIPGGPRAPLLPDSRSSAFSLT